MGMCRINEKRFTRNDTECLGGTVILFDLEYDKIRSFFYVNEIIPIFYEKEKMENNKKVIA